MPIPQLSRKIKKDWRVKPIGLVAPNKNSYSSKQIEKETKNKSLITVLLSLFIVGGIVFFIFFIWTFRSLPDPNHLLERNIEQSTKIYDRTGEIILYEVHGAQRRYLVELYEISPFLVKATINTEDKDFYNHHGFDLRGILRAFLTNLIKGGEIQGGSTITQQLIKNAVLTSQKSYIRKIKELLLAFQIENKFTKDQILKMYLNEIPYGRNAYGSEAAAQIYFNKQAKDLTLAESALLASLPKAPTYYSPDGSHQQELISRQHYIIDSMLKEKQISPEQAETAKQIDILSQIIPRREAIIAPHFVTYIKERLTNRYGQRLVEQGGLKIITTLDVDKQKSAEDIIQAQSEYNQDVLQATNTSLIAIDVPSGDILAMVGSRDWFNQEIDGQVNVSLANRQPGSSFKPIIYASAWQKGYTPDTVLFDAETNFGSGAPGQADYIPQNYTGEEYGPVTMRQALAGSLNIASVKTLYLTGLPIVLNLAKKLGYTTLTDPSRYGLSLVLGGAEIKLLEHTNAFAAFAREGIYKPATSILRVENNQGQILEERKEEVGQRALEPQIARQINSVLSDDSARSFIFGARGLLTLNNRPVAAKTGTTNDSRDAWTVGYTPSLACGVWVGNNDNASMNELAGGITAAAPIWHKFMESALLEQPVEEFNLPDSELTNQSILNGKIGQSTNGDIHNILYFINKDNPRGSEPTDPTTNSQYQHWEEAVQRWLSEKKEQIPKSFLGEELKPQIKIISPVDQAEIKENKLAVDIVLTSASSIKQIICLIDGHFADIIQQSPYQCHLNLSGLPSGKHKIIAQVFDHFGNQQTDSKDIFLMSSDHQPLIQWLSPLNNSIIYPENFPLLLSLSLPVQQDKIEQVKFFYHNLTDKRKQLISTIFNPALNKRINFTWTDSPSMGNYQLSAQIIKQNQEIINSEFIDIEIK